MSPRAYYVNGQYYYDQEQDYGRCTTDPRPLESSDDFGDLYNLKLKLIHKISPHCHDIYMGVKRRIKSRTVHKRSPCISNDDLKSERFNVKTVDLQDEDVGGGGDGDRGSSQSGH